MSYPVYSTTFCRVDTMNLWDIFEVPAGYRAVVKCVTAVSFATGGGFIYAQVGGVRVMGRSFPGAYSDYVTQMTVIAYEGERVELLNTTQLMHATMSGYLLHEIQGQSMGRIATTKAAFKGGALFSE